MELSIPRPDLSVLENRLVDSTHQVTQEALSTFFLDPRHGNGTGIEYPEEGGIYVYKIGGDLSEKDGQMFINNATPLLYPERGMPWPEAIVAINKVKRLLISQTRFFSKNKKLFIGAIFTPIKTLESWLEEFISVADEILVPYYFGDRYYTNMAKEIDKFMTAFLMGIGVSAHISKCFAKVLKTVIELDTAYRYRIEDIMSESSATKLINSPKQELNRLLSIFAEREYNRRQLDGESHVLKKARTILNGLTFALSIPRVKRAFINAVKSMDFPKIQLDEIDTYAILRFDGYNFLGQPAEVRVQRYLEMHNGLPPKPITIKHE